jgi:hypothetical protein
LIYPSAALQTLLAASLGGTVLAEEDSAPVYDATVSLIDQRLQIWQTRSGLLGSFQFDELPAGTYRLHIQPPQDLNLVGGYVDSTELCDAQSWTLEATESAEEIEALLAPGGTLQGVILDSLSEPIEGATVWAIGADETSEGEARGGNTDASGSFELRGLAGAKLSQAQWVIWVSAQGLPDQYLGPTYASDQATLFEAGPEIEAQIGTHALLNGIVVQGKVEGPDGPVREATVHVYAGGQVVTVETEADGSYLATGLPPGDILPWSSAEGLATSYYPDQDRPTEFLYLGEEGETLTGADLYLPQQSIFQLRMVDPDSGEAVPQLSALLYNDTHTVGRGDAADEDGLLRIDGLHGGVYELYIWGSSAGFTDDWVRDTDDQVSQFSLESETEGEAFEIALRPAAQLAGRVLDLDGVPVGSAWVMARPEDGNSEATMTESDGSFLISGMSEQSWSLEALVTTACPGDPGFVNTWWPSQVNPDWAPRIGLGEGERREGLEIMMPFDGDLDGMGDEWEDLWDLDRSRNDASEDPDEDGYLNISEYLLDTNPRGEALGCSATASERGGSWPWMVLMAFPVLVRRQR